MVAFSIWASSVCGGEKQKKKGVSVKAEVSLIHSLLVLYTKLWMWQGRRGECGAAQTPTASLLPGPWPCSAASLFWKSSSSGDVWLPCCRHCSCSLLPGHNEIWEGGKGFGVWGRRHRGDAGLGRSGRELPWCDNSPVHSITATTPDSPRPRDTRREINTWIIPEERGCSTCRELICLII